jgi:ADP-heptose:LPS heptosyltransferase
MTQARVILLRPLGLGDFLTGVPAMRAVARAFPDHERLLAAPAALAPLAGLSGTVDRVVDTQPLQPLAPSCYRPDIAIDMHGRGPASQRVLLASQPARLISFNNPAVPETAGFPKWRDDEHEAVRWCRMLNECAIPADPRDLDLAPPSIEAPSFARGAIVIHPGAAYPARRWPAERWAEVARSLGPDILITGTGGERQLALAVARAADIDERRVVAGQTDLLQLAAIVSQARLLLSADTGVAHLATAFRCSSVVLFGPTPPDLWGPPPERPWHRVIWKGRKGNPNGNQPDAGLLAISVEEVLHAVEEVCEERHAVRA